MKLLPVFQQNTYVSVKRLRLYSNNCSGLPFLSDISKGLHGKLGFDHVKTVFSLDFVQQFEKITIELIERSAISPEQEHKLRQAVELEKYSGRYSRDMLKIGASQSAARL